MRKITLLIALAAASAPLRAQLPSDAGLLNDFQAQGAPSQSALVAVLEKPEVHSATVLYLAAGMALKNGRLEHAAYLYYVANLRAEFDAALFPPTGDISALGALKATLGQSITPKLQDDPPAFQQVLERVKAWNPLVIAGYDPGWPHGPKGSEKSAFDALQRYRDGVFGTLQSTSDLLLIDEFRRANALAQDYSDFTRKPGHVRPAAAAFAAAEQTMERIVREQNLRDLAARLAAGSDNASSAPGLPPTAGQFARDQDEALATAAMIGDVAEVARLVAAGADPNAVSRDGLPLLAWAFLAHNLVGYEALLDQHANPAAAIKHRGLSPTLLQQTMVFHPEETFWFEALIRHGANPNFVVDPGNGDTLVFAAIDDHRLGLLAILIAHGADLNHPNSAHRTPLLETVSPGFDLTAAWLLLQGGADWRAVDASGRGFLDALGDLADRYYQNQTNKGPWLQEYVAVVRSLAVHGAVLPPKVSNFVADLSPAAPPRAPAAPDPSTLRARRDALEARLAQVAEAEDQDAAQFVALNRALGERGRSLEFYATLSPDNPARIFLARQLVREFVTRRQYADAALGWDAHQASRLFNSWSRLAVPSAQLVRGADQVPPRLLQQLLDYFEALAGAGDSVDAQELAGRIAGVDSSPETFAALNIRAVRAGHPELPATVTRASGAVVVAKGASKLADFRRSMETPSYRTETAALARGRLALYYGFLFEQLKLPDGQLAQFKDLLVRLQLASFDASQVALRRNAPPLEGNAPDVHESVEHAEAGIMALLGPEHYRLYHDYQLKLSRWLTASQLADSLRVTPSPLTGSQAARLVALLRQKTPGDQVGLGMSIESGIGLFPLPYPNRPFASVRQEAAGFLSAPQLAALHRLEQQQEIDWDEESRVPPEDPPVAGVESGAGQDVFDPAALDHQPVVLSMVHPLYPAAMKQQGISGQVLVEFFVQTDGTVANARVVTSDRPEFEPNALDAVRRWTFAPGRRGGLTVITRLRVPVVFQLSTPATVAP